MDNILILRPQKTKYCIVIPVINEGKRIQKELREMKKYAKEIDIIVTDGGSSDNATNPAFLKSQNVKAKIITPMGQSIQLMGAFSWALKQGYQGIITIDGNNKDDVSAIPEFIKALEEGYGYTQSTRFTHGGKHVNTPFYRVFFNRCVISPLLSLSAGHWYSDTPNGFRAYSRKYLLHPKVKPLRNIFKRYELLWYLTTRANRLGLKSKEIPTIRSYPKNEVPTKIVGWKRVSDMWNILKIALGLYNP